jgi:hypothetical protein
MRLTPKGGESLFPPPTGVVCNMMPIIVGRHETLPEEFRGSVLSFRSISHISVVTFCNVLVPLFCSRPHCYRVFMFQPCIPTCFSVTRR